MSRRTPHRAALTAALVTPFLLPLWAASPAQAHGAPTDPVSRVYACSPDGGSDARSAACRATVAANGGPFTLWDNLRVPDVGGRDRQVIPDGKLCSGGLSAYKGLDLARSDWPSTTLTAGATLSMKYASTIPHTGTFKLYLTKPGYDPARPLTWSELPSQPFATVKDPALTNGAYRITAKLPSDRTGHHVLYTIWQNSSTTDTYYSCSDVVFRSASGNGGKAAAPSTGANTGTGKGVGSDGGKKASTDSPTATPTSSTTPSRTAESAASPRQGTGAPDSTPVASASTAGSGPSAPMLAGGAAAVLVLTGGAALALRLRRR